MRSFFCLFFIIPLLITGCAAEKQTARQLHQHPANEWVQEAADKFHFYQQSVPAIAERQIYTQIYTDAHPNAYVDYNDYYIAIMISDSLINHLNDTTINCLFAHECAHAEYSHIGKKAALSNAVSLLVNVADAVVPGYGIGAANVLLNPLVVNTFSRAEETQADVRALDYLAPMRITSMDYAEFLEVVKSITPPDTQGGGLLDTHPNFQDRVDKVLKEGQSVIIPNTMEPYTPGKNYFTALQSVAEVSARFPFDIGPYGQSKAALLESSMTETELSELFDGMPPAKKKNINDRDSIWVYRIPQREYSFFVLIRKDSSGDRLVRGYTISKNNTSMTDITDEFKNL
ncbi:MAG: M48 family metalloprotease [Candidatus Auribacterota bacterium]